MPLFVGFPSLHHGWLNKGSHATLQLGGHPRRAFTSENRENRMSPPRQARSPKSQDHEPKSPNSTRSRVLDATAVLVKLHRLLVHRGAKAVGLSRLWRICACFRAKCEGGLWVQSL